MRPCWLIWIPPVVLMLGSAWSMLAPRLPQFLKLFVYSILFPSGWLGQQGLPASLARPIHVGFMFIQPASQPVNQPARFQSAPRPARLVPAPVLESASHHLSSPLRLFPYPAFVASAPCLYYCLCSLCHTGLLLVHLFVFSPFCSSLFPQFLLPACFRFKEWLWLRR